MSYNIIITDYIDKIKTQILESLLCTTNILYTEEIGTDIDGNVIYKSFINDNSSPVNNVIEILEKLIIAIDNTYRYLFVDPTYVDDNGVVLKNNTNYQIINGYADGTKSFDNYNIETQEFLKDANFWFARGNMYEMLTKVKDGGYLYKRLNGYPASLIEDIEYLLEVSKDLNSEDPKSDEYYSKPGEHQIEHSETVVEGTDSNENPLLKTYYYAKARDLVDACERVQNNCNTNYLSTYSYQISTSEGMKTITRDCLKGKTNSLIQIVNDFIDIYDTYIGWISSADTFVSALTKTSIGEGTCLGDTYEYLGSDSINRFSYGLGDVYKVFQRALSIRDNSKYKDDDKSNIKLGKICSSLILNSSMSGLKNDIIIDGEDNYFNKAKELYNSVLEYRKFYEL